MILPRFISLCAVICLISSCTSATDEFEVKYSPCETLQLLIDEHANGFESFRSKPKYSKKLTVWATKYQAIGEHCQVWEWKSGSITYTCNETFPAKDLAEEKYFDQQKVIQSCLGDDWQKMEEPRSLAVGERTVYSSAGTDTHVALHLVETKDLLKSVWTVYYFVGDFEKNL